MGRKVSKFLIYTVSSAISILILIEIATVKVQAQLVPVLYIHFLQVCHFGVAA